MSKKLGKEEFIRKAKEIHGDKYSYAKTNYDGYRSIVEVICKDHGQFFVKASAHLSFFDYGLCPKCREQSIWSKQQTKHNKWISDSKKIHNDKYDYSESQYVSLTKLVTIKCPQHGIFKQRADVHRNGGGCQKCAQIKQAQSCTNEITMNKPTFLYYVKINNLWKIGVTNKTISLRYRGDIINGINVEEILIKKFPDRQSALDVEEMILKENSQLRYNGEKFMITGGETEMFYEDITEKIKDYFG